nr:acetate--CoA ligase family protein [uncultured Desulfobacter sp.]
MKNSHALDILFNPKAIVAVGASSNPAKIGGRIFRYTKDNGYTGKLYPINAKHRQVQGVPTLPSISDLPTNVDLAYIMVPAPAVVEIMEKLAERQVKAAMIFSSGFAEMSTEGIAAQQRIAAIAHESGMRVLGPNCMGAINIDNGMVGTFARTFDQGLPPPGVIGFASQSGAFGSYGLYRCLERGLGISLWCTTGNEVDVDVAECLEYMALDEQTKVILCYIEGCRNRDRLIQALELARSRRKPVVMLKVGRTQLGAMAAASHTASLVGVDAVYDAVFRQYGVHRVNSIEELLDVAYVCSAGIFPKSNRVGLLSSSGGIAILMADTATGFGLQAPELSQEAQARLKKLIPYSATRNPVDMTAQATYNQMLVKDYIEVVLAQDNVDSLVCFLPPARTPEYRKLLPPELKRLRQQYPDKALILCSSEEPNAKQPYEDAGFLVIEDPTRALRSLTALYNYGRSFAQAKQAKGIESTVLIPEQAMSEYAAKKLLAKAGIPVITERLTTSAQEARAAAQAMGYPVVMKIASADILHKTEIGGVLLNLNGPQAVVDAFYKLMRNARKATSKARLDGVIVAPMVTDGVETILGIQRDPVFGPVVLFGLGGIFVEVFKDVAMRLAPFGEDAAAQMIREIKGFALLQGVRGKGPMDIETLIKTLARLSAFAAVNADRLDSLDLNPFIVRPRGKGALALDALIVPCQFRPASGNDSLAQPDNPDLDFAPGLMVKSAS